MTATDIVTGLYVPGHRPDRFAKAIASGADLVVFDLEDAVPADQKDAARTAVAIYVKGLLTSCVVQVRVNPPDTVAGRADLAMVAGLPPAVELRLPKVEQSDDVDRALDMAGQRPVTALLESPNAVLVAASLAATPGVTRLGLGESDLSSAFGIRSAALIDHARLTVVFAARAVGLPAPMLSPYPPIRDEEGLRADTERGRFLGWVGRMAIHPSQLAVIAAVFAPSADEVAWAREVMAALEGGGVTTLDNREMVDPAMRDRAAAILRRA
jgi:citrate lyase subunit beta/citryl-CoA lyase